MAARQRLAAAVLLIGLGLVAVGQLPPMARPAPLFDGVFVEEPYRFVEPAAGEAGDPQPAQLGEPVTNGAVALLAVATSEGPPQAQMIAQADAFAISADTTSVSVSIQPIAAHDPQVLGNIYRIAVTDQAGAALEARPAALITVVLRTPAPNPNPDAQLARFDGTRWVTLATDHGGLPDLFSANIDQFGDYAVILPGYAVASLSPGPRPAMSPASRPAHLVARGKAASPPAAAAGLGW